MKSISKALIGIALLPRCPFAEIGTVLNRFQVHFKNMSTGFYWYYATIRSTNLGAKYWNRSWLLQGSVSKSSPILHIFLSIIFFLQSSGSGANAWHSRYRSVVPVPHDASHGNQCDQPDHGWPADMSVQDISYKKARSFEQHFETPPKIWPGQSPSAHFRCSSWAIYCVVVVGAGVVVVVAYKL